MARLFADGYALRARRTTPRPWLDGVPPMALPARGETDRTAAHMVPERARA